MVDYAKKHQRYCTQASCNIDDRISTLPDSLLHHILSFLPINLVIGLSILARRWRYLWKTVPVINLDVSELPFRMSTLMLTRSKFFGHCFRRHVGKKVQRLCISLTYYQVKNRHIRSMVSFVRRRKVEELDMNLDKYWVAYSNPSNVKYVVPESLFECGALKELKLAGCRLKIPSSFGFPLLKKLHIRLVILPDLDTSGCPMLEELIISECNSNGAFTLSPLSEPNPNGCLNIYAPNRKLKILKIHEHKQVEERETELVIYAPHVLSIEISGYMRTQYNFKNLSSISTATLEFKTWWRNDYSVLKLMKLLTYLHQAKTLEICERCIQILSFREVISSEIPQLSASSLELETTLSELGLPGLICLLRNSCNVETLIIKICHEDRPLGIWDSLTDYCYDESRYWELLELVLSAHSHLANVKITYCIGREFSINTFLENTQKETELLRILLKCCKVLETVTICLTCAIDGDWLCNFNDWPGKSEFHLRLSEKLSVFPRACPNAKICLRTRVVGTS